MAEKLRLLSLFAGIGGFELGLERSGYFETVAQCEIDPFCRRVLAKHWPNVRRYEDVRELTAARLAADGVAVDAICGGFPCQDVSVAGRRAGIDAPRSGLWREYGRIICEVRPRIIFVENVTGLLHNGFGTVLRDLASFGYDAEWHCIPASAIGAPHGRDRVWVMAYSQQEQRLCPIFDADDAAEACRTNAAEWREDGFRFEMGAARRSVFGRWMDQPDPIRMANGISDWPHRLGGCGNAVVPQIPELLGRAYGQAMLERH